MIRFRRKKGSTGCAIQRLFRNSMMRRQSCGRRVVVFNNEPGANLVAKPRKVFTEETALPQVSTAEEL